MKLDKATYKPCDPIVVTVTVKNTGTVDSDEVVQLYRAPPACAPFLLDSCSAPPS